MLSLLRPKFSNKIYHLSVDGANKLVLKVGLSIFDKITRVRDLSSENKSILAQLEVCSIK